MKDPRMRWRDPAQPQPSADELERAREFGVRLGRAAPALEVMDAELEELRHASREAWQSFYQAFSETLAEAPEQRTKWVQTLLANFESLAREPAALLRFPTEQEREQWLARIEAWNGTEDPLAAWPDDRGRVSLDLNHPAFAGLPLLSRIDVASYVEALELLPHPAAQQLALRYTDGIYEDRELLLELLEQAPPMFDSEGQWLASRSVVALLLTKQIVVHADELRSGIAHARRMNEARPHHPKRAPAELPSDEDLDRELAQWFERAFAVLLARPEGAQLGIAACIELTKRALRRSLQHSAQQPLRPSFAGPGTALGALADALGAAGVSSADFERSWRRSLVRLRTKQSPSRRRRDHRKTRERGEGAQTLVGDGLSVLCAAALNLLAEPRPAPRTSQELEAFWAWARELLRGRDEGLGILSLDNTASLVVPRLLGYLLAQTDAPAALFDQMYTELEAQRRRARFGARYEDTGQDEPSLWLLRVGLNASANWAIQASALEPARALFWSIYAAARRLWLTAWSDYQDRKRKLVPSCFAFMPHLFGDTLATALARALPPLASDPLLLAEAAQHMLNNGADLDVLRAAYRDAGIELEDALRDAKQWATLANPDEHRVVRESLFPASLEQLAERMEIDFEAPASTIDEHGARLAQFERHVPWAGALREQVTREGGELRLASPLDSELAWLIQISLPKQLQQRFGLSPELRVLAVHGQVRGRALRQALQHPERGELVDPDLIVVTSRQPGLARRLPTLAGPWGQRVPWIPSEGRAPPFADLGEVLSEHLPRFDVFDYRDPVRGSALIGREREIEDISARLTRGETVGVVGLRKVGKSSLLRAVAERLDPVGARLGMFESLRVPLPEIDDPETLVVSMDVQGLPLRTLDALAEHLRHELDERLALLEPSTPTGPAEARPTGVIVDTLVTPPADATDGVDDGREPLERFAASLSAALERTQASLCFVFDEYDLMFEGYSGEPGIIGIEQLFAVLRAQSQSTQRVAVAFIGRDPKFLEQPLLTGVSSPLPARTKPIYLGPLRRAGADELLTRLGRRTGLEVGPQTLELAWSMTGGHPLLMRQFGSVLLRLARESDAETRGESIATDDFCERARAAFSASEVVYTLRSEIEALLEARYLRALALLAALSRGEAAPAADSLERQRLVSFGLLTATEPPAVPEVYRAWFAGYGAALDKGA